MEEAVWINDYGQGCASDGNFIQTDQLDKWANHNFSAKLASVKCSPIFSMISMDLNLASTLLDLDEEDLTEIHRMVDEWEFNFGSLEVNILNNNRLNC